ncbi:hypothetical protein DFP73DRAFT_620998 [Morchella snyderi]|nr:hypothetical protein DFP73DRAFT_620998 [Morchella snyderi]
MALEQLLDSDFNGNATIDNSRAEALHRQRNELQVRYNNVEFAWAQSVKEAYQNVCEASQILAKSCEIARGAIIADTTSGGPDSVTMRNADDIDSLTLMGEEPPPLKGQFIRQARSAQPLRPNQFTSEASSAPPTRRVSTLDLRSAPPSGVPQSRTPSRVPAWQFSSGAGTSTAAFSGAPSQSLISVSDASLASEGNNKRMKFTFTSIIERFPTARNEHISPDTYDQALMIASEPAGILEPGEIHEAPLERFHLIENPYHRRPAAQSAPSADSFESHRREQPKPPSQ